MFHSDMIDKFLLRHVEGFTIGLSPRYITNFPVSLCLFLKPRTVNENLLQLSFVSENHLIQY
ncbi:hypothetical protein GCM10008986_31160 [Salinibacillus aidingensis]|uniref:Uncharacterized protein n=1 Tax=Salinibacillus aidingensis TaxID=237684 RepID=A0ABN1BNX6_9BACI